MEEGGATVKNFIIDFLTKELNNFLHRNAATADLIKRRIVLRSLPHNGMGFY